MTEVQVVEPVEVLVPLDVVEAGRLDKRIRLMAQTARDNFEKVGRLLDEAKRGNVHEVLGFKSWPAYIADAVGGQLQLSGEARQAMVALMAGEGMSVRAIATATGVSKSTVSNDIAAQVSNSWTPQEDSAEAGVQRLDTSSGKPAVVTGVDGKTYTRAPRKPRPKKEPAPIEPTVKPRAARRKVGAGSIAATVAELQESTRKVQVPTAYRNTVKAIRPLVDDLVALNRDPRWDKSLDRFTHADRAALDAHIENLRMLRAAMGESA